MHDFNRELTFLISFFVYLRPCRSSGIAIAFALINKPTLDQDMPRC
jgi:hypothetical protein